MSNNLVHQTSPLAAEPRASFALLRTIWAITPVYKQACLSSARMAAILNPSHSDLFPVYWQPKNICSRISSCARWEYEFILESPWLRVERPQDRGSIPDKGRHFYVRNLWLALHWRWGFWSFWKTDTKASKERCAFIFMGCGVLEDIITLGDIITTVLRNVRISIPLHSTTPRNTKTFGHLSLLHRIPTDSGPIQFPIWLLSRALSRSSSWNVKFAIHLQWVKNSWSCNFDFPYGFLLWRLTKQSNNSYEDISDIPP